MNESLDTLIIDEMITRPIPFEVGAQWFYLYPLTLGKIKLTSGLIRALQVDEKTLTTNIYLEALRVAEKKRDTCLELIVCYTCKTKAEVFDYELNRKRHSFFSKHMDAEDIASLMLFLLTSDKTEQIMTHLGISKEQERMGKVLKKKAEDDKYSVSFGGKSIYGSLIDIACERYGWTYDYVLWGISYINLRLMLADKISTITLTEKDRKRIPASYLQGGESIKGDDPKNMELIHQMNWH